MQHALAVPAAMSLTPSSQTVTQGTTVSVTVRENSDTDTIHAARAKINYPTDKLVFSGIDYTTSAFDVRPAHTVSGGVLNFTVGKTGTPLTGSQIVAVVNFEAVAPGSANITFGCIYDPSTCTDGNVVLRSPDNVNILTSTTGATATINSPPNLSGPASVSWANGRIDIFIRGTDNALWHKWFQGGWSNWESLGGTLGSSPTVSSWAPGRLDVFATNGSGVPIHKWYEGGWSNWETFDGVAASGSSPAAASWSYGRIDLFVRGTNNALWHKWFGVSSGWSGWAPLGGILSGSPSVSTRTPGQLDVFAADTNGAVVHKFYAFPGWSEWGYPGGTVFAGSGPGSDSWSNDRIDVVVRGTDSALYHKFYQGGWSGWHWLGVTLASSPSVAAWAPGRLDVFAAGVNSDVIHKFYSSGWSGWESLGGTVAP